MCAEQRLQNDPLSFVETWLRPSLKKLFFFLFLTTGKRTLVWEQGCCVKAGITLIFQNEPRVCKLLVKRKQLKKQKKKPKNKWRWWERRGQQDHITSLKVIQIQTNHLTPIKVAKILTFQLDKHLKRENSLNKISIFQYKVTSFKRVKYLEVNS